MATAIVQHAWAGLGKPMGQPHPTLPLGQSPRALTEATVWTVFWGLAACGSAALLWLVTDTAEAGLAHEGRMHVVTALLWLVAEPVEAAIEHRGAPVLRHLAGVLALTFPLLVATSATRKNWQRGMVAHRTIPLGIAVAAFLWYRSPTHLTLALPIGGALTLAALATGPLLDRLPERQGSWWRGLRGALYRPAAPSPVTQLWRDMFASMARGAAVGAAFLFAGCAIAFPILVATGSADELGDAAPAFGWAMGITLTAIGISLPHGVPQRARQLGQYARMWRVMPVPPRTLARTSFTSFWLAAAITLGCIALFTLVPGSDRRLAVLAAGITVAMHYFLSGPGAAATVGTDRQRRGAIALGISLGCIVILLTTLCELIPLINLRLATPLLIGGTAICVAVVTWDAVVRPLRFLDVRVMVGMVLAVAAVAVSLPVTLDRWELRQTMARIEARGETLDMNALWPAPVPAEQNGAHAWMDACARIADVERQLAMVSARQASRDGTLPAWERAWMEFTKLGFNVHIFRRYDVALRQRLVMHANGLQSAERALDSPAIRIDRRPLFAEDRRDNYIEPTYTLANLWCLAAIAHAADGRTDQAASYAALPVRLANLLAPHPDEALDYLRQRLVRRSRIATRRILALGAPSSESLRDLANVFQEAAAHTDPLATLQWERAVRYATVDERQAKYLQSFEPYFAAVRLPIQVAVERIEDLQHRNYQRAWWQRPREWRHWWPDDVVESHAEMRAYARTAAVGLRLLAEGVAPQEMQARLAALPAELTTDSYDGKTLRVRIEEDTLLVYSVGRNGRDDGGTAVWTDGQTWEDHNDDIAFRVPLPAARSGL